VNLETVSLDDPTIGTVSCPLPPDPGLAPGAAETCTADAAHTVTQADVDAGQVVDTATAGCKDVTGGTCQPSPPSKVTIPGTPPHPTVSIQKLAHASGGDSSPIKVGQTISYSYLVTNTGNVSLSSVTVDDPTAGGVSCPAVGSGGLLPGGSVTCTGDDQHTVTQSDVDSGQVTDTATAGCKDVQGGSCPPSPPSEVGVPSAPDPRVAMVKSGTVTPAADQNAVKVGDTIAYSYKVTNIGNVTLRSVSVSDPSDGSVSCPTPAAPGLAIGASLTYTADAAHTVTLADIDAGKIADTATAGCTDTQGKACPPSDPSTVTVSATDPKPSVAIVKSAAVTPSADQNAAKVGDTIAYSYKVTNTWHRSS
jgi:large repetitive protein